MNEMLKAEIARIAALICPIDLAILFLFVVFIIGTIIFIYRIFKPRGCFHSDHIVDQIHPVENKKGDVK